MKYLSLALAVISVLLSVYANYKINKLYKKNFCTNLDKDVDIEKLAEEASEKIMIDILKELTKKD